jgi:hypothetical protein
MEHEILVSLPSGNVLKVFGEEPIFGMVGDENCITVLLTKDAVLPGSQQVKAGEAIIFDPRAVVRVDGLEIYNPRMPGFYEGLTSNWKQWLLENPWWPGD